MSVFDGYMIQLGPVDALVTGRDMTLSVDREIDFWDGRIETDPEVQSRLKEYWDNIGITNWSAAGTPWSAAFVSYLLKGSRGFKGDSAHWVYTRDIIAGEYPGWTAYNLPLNVYGPGIEVNVGDILVRKRAGSNTAGHGDVVYSVDTDSGYAYLIGGNLGDTVKTKRIDLLNLKPGSRRIGDTDYQIILKKDGSEKKTPLLFLAAGVLVWIMSR